MNKRYLNCLAVLWVGAFPSLSVAEEELYHCIGNYNTGAEYNHLYTVDRSILGGTVDWEGDTLKIKEHPLYLFAVAVKSGGVDMLFIETKTLKAEFSSIKYMQPFLAKGQCKKLK